jgi:outer membrane protein OmpA-like peptidoglycan-associated protein
LNHYLLTNKQFAFFFILFHQISALNQNYMRRLLLSSTLLMMFCTIAMAQNEDLNNTTGWGIKAGVNYSTLKIGGSNPNNVDFGWKPGFVGGLFGHVPLGEGRWGIQTELLYSQMGGDVIRGLATGDRRYNLNNISLPILLKLHLNSEVRLLLGPQIDYTFNAKRETGGTTADADELMSNGQFLVTGGAEWWPNYNWGIGGRYMQGLNDVDEAGYPFSLKSGGMQGYISYRIGKKPVPPPPPPPPAPVVTDRDNDGIADPNDKCPDVPGLAKYEGCPIPDSDKDGINDEQDKCPQVPGLAKYQGCPIPDTDKDGINDEEDKCPQVPGLARYQGCPIPDTDGDGINDEEDKCPTIPGIPENGGCPAINFKSENVQFVSGSSTLTSGAKAELNKLVKILNQDYPDIKIAIEGHTDNTGKADKNQVLSEKRAESVKTYLVGKKVAAERLSTAGYGADQPIADNATSAGKAKNRRVTFKVSQ